MIKVPYVADGNGDADAMSGDTDAFNMIDTAGATTDIVVGVGSGIVFNNTFTAGVSQAYRNCVIAAEQTIQSQWSNPITINVTFDAQNNGQNGGLASNSFSIVQASYSQLRTALGSHATSSIAQAAVASLPSSDPSGGSGFWLPVAYARMLGLTANAPGTDDTVILNTGYNWSFGQDVTDTVIHELTEGGMGRIGGLGDGLGGRWSSMDLFRYSFAGVRDFTDGRDGLTPFFSYNGSQLSSLSFNNEYNSSGIRVSTGDTADFTQLDVFGTGSPGEINTLSQTDLQVMDALDWMPASPPPATSDLIPENIALGSSSVVAGGSLSVNWDILNQGTAAANSTSTTEVRITSSSTSAAGTNLAGLSTLALGAGASQSENTGLPVPTTPGTYYVWVIADNFTNVSNQSNTSNDLQHSAAFTVTASPPPPRPPASDGAALLAGGGILTTADGVWSFGAAAPGGFSILLNGQSAAGASAATLEVAAGGHLFADNAFGNWSEWNGTGWTPSAVPPSPDGTALPAGGAGSLTTSDGVWSFGAAAAGGFLILRNGQSAAGGSAASLEVAQNGHLFADNAFGNWYEWNGSGWSPSATPPSPDGMALPAGGAGTLMTSDGVWSFGAAAAGGFSILRNGQSAAGGSASSLEVAQNGHLFADNAFGDWYEWNGSGWAPSASPGVSSDGTVLLAADGSALTTADGVWSFGAAGPGGFSILRNGQSAAGGSATSLEVAQNGHLFADSAFGNWYEWNGSGWSLSAVPPSADGATLLAGDGSALTTADGVWSFGAAAAGGFLILRNGQSAADGSAVSLEVAQNGHLFADTAFGNWYEWSGSGWSPSVIPPSPDGTALPAGSGGTLSTADGVWGFGAAAAGGFSVLLNGQSAAGGSASSLEVAQNGHVFADTAAGNWSEWNGSGWGASADPTITTPPHVAINTPYLHV